MNDIRVNLPAKLRIALYILAGILSPIIAVLTLPEVAILPSWVMLVWTGEVAFVGTMAALNVNSPKLKDPIENEPEEGM